MVCLRGCLANGLPTLRSVRGLDCPRLGLLRSAKGPIVFGSIVTGVYCKARRESSQIGLAAVKLGGFIEGSARSFASSLLRKGRKERGLVAERVDFRGGFRLGVKNLSHFFARRH